MNSSDIGRIRGDLSHGLSWITPGARPEAGPGNAGPRHHALPAGFAELPIRDAIARAAERDPDAPAIAGSGERLTFGQLMDRIDAVAHAIVALTPDGCAIGTVLSDTPRGLAVLLGCVAARRICVSLDPAHPRERTLSILREADVAAVVTDDDGVVAPGGISLIRAADLPCAADRRPLPPPFGPDEPAVVSYTSGSTGRPKGVVSSTFMVLHRARIGIEQFGMRAPDRLLNLTPGSAASGLSHRLAALCSGSCVVLHSVAAHGIAAVLPLLRAERITFLIAGPALARPLWHSADARAAFASLRVLRCAAAALLQADIEAARAVLPADCVIEHTYASTEAGIISQWPIPRGYCADEPRLPSGNVMDGLDYAFIPAPVDEHGGSMADTARGTAGGELVVRSRSVAVGEWQAGRCVPGRMLPDPTDPRRRIFRTGDIMRVGDDALLRFVGRGDQQIKINGFRIEPAEIEAVLRKDPAVADAVVVARPRRGDPVLHAYVAATEADTGKLRNRLLDRLRSDLPPAMRPAQVIVLPQLPRLPGGKIDMTALPEPGRSAFRAARSEREAMLCGLFAELTGTETVGIDDGFFALGGDSLLAMRLVTVLHERSGRECPINLIYAYPTPAQLAPMLDEIPTYTPLLSLRPNGDVAPLFCVHPVSGYALAFRYLAEALDPRIPVWGLQARGLQHGDAPHGSLDAMASAYVDAIRTVQPKGPYRLLGWSIGGFIAHAMACQLEAQGDVVDLLGLLDTPAVPGIPDGADVASLPADGLASMDARAAQVFRAAAIARGLLPADASEAWGTGMLEQMRLAPARMRDFTPRRCRAPVLLFRASKEPRNGDGDAMFGWETLTEGAVERVPIACRHAELGDGVHAAQIAAALGGRLV